MCHVRAQSNRILTRDIVTSQVENCSHIWLIGNNVEQLKFPLFSVILLLPTSPCFTFVLLH